MGEKRDDTRLLTERFTDAVGFARRVHQGQLRKGAATPYLSHPLAVASLVLEDGGDEDEAIAGLLHDAVEDGGGKPVLEQIRSDFGDRVASIVWACSDTDQEPKPPWKERKTAYLEHVRKASADVRRVSSADKLHNARAILKDYREIGDELWSRFSATRDETLWYYRELVKAFQEAGGGRLTDELGRVVSQLEAEIGE
jgi:(p)ppGpp synthase/HD superfamily hydrolase